MFKSCEISHLIRLARFCIIYLPNAPLHALKISAKATRNVSDTFSCYFFAFHIHAYCLGLIFSNGTFQDIFQLPTYTYLALI